MLVAGLAGGVVAAVIVLYILQASRVSLRISACANKACIAVTYFATYTWGFGAP